MTETWLRHPAFNYEVSSEGRVRHCLTKTIRKLHADRDGYWRFNAKLPGRCCVPLKVATLVCEAFHGERPFDQAEVRHGERGQQCDAADNLSWGSRLDRPPPAPKRGPHLTLVDVQEIRRLGNSVSQLAISRRYGISPSNVRSILTGLTWAGVRP